MNVLLQTALSNALVAEVLALVVWAITRFRKAAGLRHGLFMTWDREDSLTQSRSDRSDLGWRKNFDNSKSGQTGMSVRSRRETGARGIDLLCRLFSRRQNPCHGWRRGDRQILESGNPFEIVMRLVLRKLRSSIS